MRQRRTEFSSLSGVQTVLLANRMRPGLPVMNFEDRAMLRKFVERAAAAESFELLTWCYLPTSFRIALQGRLTPDRKIDKNDHSGVQEYPIARFAKSLFVSFGHWRNFRGVDSQIWQERYRSTSLATAGEQLAGAVSIDLTPVLHGFVDRAEDYYFSGFHDACGGDQRARAGIASLVGQPGASWSNVRTSYTRLLNGAKSRVSELVE